ncbi:252_t:CDS:10 [Cetraspora pellucida]|uniref:252_t:CDS:1 n=1 Tax=Cetraspora pellucida TaxID=1433469 RepID=A0A9N8Z9S9_9GLOM|nr:252_t:CDS:10 [Cetraspora pellucida]
MPQRNHKPSDKIQKRTIRRTKFKKQSHDSTDDPMEIPGFYYDRERGRYFKIMPGHTFGHSTNASGIMTKRKAEGNVNLLTKPRISTCNSLLNACEFNLSKTIHRLQREWKEIFVKSLCYVGTIQQTIPFSLSHRITDFQIHPTSNELYYGNTDGMVGLLKFQASSKTCSEIFSKPFAYCNSEITSIRIIGESLIIYTSLGNHLCSGILCIEHLPEVTDFDMVHETNAYNYQTRSTVWTSTSSQIDEWIALGATNYISVLSNYSVPGARFTNIKTNSDPSAIFAGCRDGRLLLFDVRCNPKKSSPNGDGPMIKQSSPICNLKQVSSWYVLSDGMDGSLSLWDIRNQRRSQSIGESTSPVFKYFGHVNSTNRRTGFAVNSNNSVVAIGSSLFVSAYLNLKIIIYLFILLTELIIAGQDNFVRFFSINTGDVVRLPIGPFEDTVSTVRFCERDEQQNYEFIPDGDNLEHYNKGEGIWISIGKELQWWSVP